MCARAYVCVSVCSSVECVRVRFRMTVSIHPSVFLSPREHLSAPTEPHRPSQSLGGRTRSRQRRTKIGMTQLPEQRFLPRRSTGEPRFPLHSPRIRRKADENVCVTVDKTSIARRGHSHESRTPVTNGEENKTLDIDFKQKEWLRSSTYDIWYDKTIQCIDIFLYFKRNSLTKF